MNRELTRDAIKSDRTEDILEGNRDRAVGFWGKKMGGEVGRDRCPAKKEPLWNDRDGRGLE